MKLKIAGCLATAALIVTGAVVIVVVRGLKELNGILESMTYDQIDL